jgi:AcrR family transcriptional regulator
VAATKTRASGCCNAGLRLFAQQGYSKTSTRELAEAANVNVASISYYFGDKAGLYRAVFFEPMGGKAEPKRLPVTATRGSVWHRRCAVSTTGFLEPLKQGDLARLCMKLHFRELLEPTGLWEEELAHGIKPMHDALRGRAMPPPRPGAGPTDDLLRLAVCLAGLGVHMHIGRDVTDRVAPGLNDDADAIDRWADRLVMFGLAMVRADADRRGMRLGASNGEH